MGGNKVSVVDNRDREGGGGLNQMKGEGLQEWCDIFLTISAGRKRGGQYDREGEN